MLLPKARAYVQDYDERTKWCIFWLKMMTFSTNIILFGTNSVTILITMYNNEHVCNRIFLKTKTKSDGDETTDFDDKRVTKVDSNYTRLAEISLDSILKTDENYFLQVFLKEWKYIFKKSDCTYYWWPWKFFLWFWWRLKLNITMVFDKYLSWLMIEVATF